MISSALLACRYFLLESILLRSSSLIIPLSIKISLAFISSSLTSLSTHLIKLVASAFGGLLPVSGLSSLI